MNIKTRLQRLERRRPRWHQLPPEHAAAIRAAALDALRCEHGELQDDELIRLMIEGDPKLQARLRTLKGESLRGGDEH